MLGELFAVIYSINHWQPGMFILTVWEMMIFRVLLD